jgi:hypothetical protein
MQSMDTEEHRFLQKRKFKLLGRWSTAPEAMACRLRHTDPGRFRSLIFHAFDDLLLAARERGGSDPLANRSPLLIRFNLPGDAAEEDFNAVLAAGGRTILQFVEEDGFMRRFGFERQQPVKESILEALSRMQEREHQTLLHGGIAVPFPFCSHCGKELEESEMHPHS